MKSVTFLVLFLLFLVESVYSMPDYDTIIVGGGLAGLNTARGLKRAGKNFLLIEARDRLGGRAYSIGEPPLEAGPEWVDKDHAQIHQLAAELGVELEEESAAKTSIRIHRKRVMWAEDFGRPFKSAYTKIKDLPSPYEEGKEGTVDETFLAYLKRKKIIFTEDEKEAINYVLRDDPGVDLKTVSYAALSYIRGELEDYFRDSGSSDSDSEEEEEYLFVNGTRSFIEAIAKDIGKESILLSSPLKKLSRDGDGLYHLELEGSKLTAERVVLSLPFSVLRENEILDDASLGIPQDVRHVIDTMPYGSVASVLIPGDMASGIEYDNLDQQVNAWTRPGGLRLWIGGERVNTLKKDSPELEAILKVAHDKLRHDGVQIEGKPFHFVNWATDPYARGSYNAYWLTQSIFRPSEFNQRMNWFATPLNANTLFFIGEHTMLASAYMESAIRSGRIVADFLTTPTE